MKSRKRGSLSESLQLKLLKLLPSVEKPSRYLPVELNTADKSGCKGLLRAALVFPDVYETGMSHHGLQLLYSLGNAIDGVWVERSFTPWPDMGKLLQREEIPLYTLESMTPLKEMDVVAFTLMTELSYTNILYTLDLAGIPLRSGERGKGDPLIVAGGACSANPLPLEPYIDAFGIGDGEILWPRLLDLLKNGEPGRRSQMVDTVAKLPGWLVPGASDIPTERVFIQNLSTSPVPVTPIVPAATPIHSRFTIEIMRGCTQGCRYCQAGFWYRPLRERECDDLLDAIEKGIASSGFDEVGLLSLSTTDYSQILPLVERASEKLTPDHVALSIPSSRLDSLSLDLLEAISRERKPGLTLAPEAGTERLRRVINKPFTDEEIVDSITLAQKRGWRRVKLYFMLGLPTETEIDVIGIGKLAKKILSTGIRDVVIHAGNFIPKPWTPFQWSESAGRELLKERQDLLRDSCRHRKITVKTVDPLLSEVEALLSRSGREGAELLFYAYSNGALFDGWGDQFNRTVWQQLLDDLPADRRRAITGWSTEDTLPWEEAVNPGINRHFLLKEFDRSLQGEITEDCRFGCLGCGIPGMPQDSVISGNPRDQKKRTIQDEIQTGPISSERDLTYRYLVKVTRMGRSSLLSYRDYQEFLIRLFRLAGARFLYSGKFHPIPRIAGSMALPVGIESLDERFELTLEEPFDNLETVIFPGEMGISLLDAQLLQAGTPRLSQRIRGYRFSIRSRVDLDPVPEGITLNRRDDFTEITLSGIQPSLRKFMALLPGGVVLTKETTILD